MLNDAVSDNSGNDQSNNNIIKLLTDGDYNLDKTFKIQKIDKEKLKETRSSHVLLHLPSNILIDSLDYCSKQLGEDMEISDYFLILLSDYNKRFETQHLTTSSLMFDGRKPRKDVLEKLEIICPKLEWIDDFPLISELNLRLVIKDALGNMDQRTLDKYRNCIKNFTEQKSGQKLRWKEKINVEGFHDMVIKALDEK
jgi:hypothetical protein